MQTSTFARMGGRAAVERLIDCLYDRLERDPALREFFPRRKPDERARQKLFFEELFGGEARYTAAGHRHEGMQRRHEHKNVTPEGAERWLAHFRSALGDAGVPDAAAGEIMTSLAPVAGRLTNAGAPRQSVLAAIELAGRGDADGVKAALSKWPSMLDQRGRNGATLLWQACRRGREPLVRWLVERGANLDVPGSAAEAPALLLSPYCAARASGHDAIARYLIERGAAYDVFAAAYLGDIAALKTMLAAEPNIVAAESPEEAFYPITPLHYAVYGNRPAAARLLIDGGAPVAPHSRVLLSLAAACATIDMVSLLLKAGASATQAEALGPLEGDAAIARLLVARGLDINRHRLNGETYLTRACRGDKGEHPEAVALLLDLGADINIRGNGGRSALHNAAKAGFARVVELLLARGADRTALDAGGATPLDLALAAGRAEVVEMLQPLTNSELPGQPE